MGKEAARLSLEDAVAPQLHKILRDRIVECDLEPGQRISETEIATSYEVSRQPVREAFIKLAGEQLVTIRPQRGTYIQRISAKAALAARFVREAVEIELAKRAVAFASDKDLAALDAEVEKQRIAVETEAPVVFMRLDEDFHRLLAIVAQAPEVSKYLDGLNVQMNRVRNISARQFSRENLMLQHAAIVDAIRSREPHGAEMAMRHHLQEFNKDLPRVIEAYPDYFDEEETTK